MTNVKDSLNTSSQPGVMPAGTAVADFKTYPEAVEYVERIIRGDFPPAAIAIVGTGLSTVEKSFLKSTTERLLSVGELTASGSVQRSISSSVFPTQTPVVPKHSYSILPQRY